MSPAPSFPIKVGHIDDVQELGKTKPSYIPERFVRNMTERPTLSTPSSCDLKIPVIDLSKLFNENNNSSQNFLSELSNLTLACQEWGFFQVLLLLLLSSS